MRITASAEDYLETILLLSKKTGAVRSIDIVGETGYSKPSVSIAMKKLREDGLIDMDKDGFIYLTDDGKKAAESVYERHAILYDWLTQNGVSPQTAALDACRMEHILSDEAFEMIRRLLQ